VTLWREKKETGGALKGEGTNLIGGGENFETQGWDAFYFAGKGAGDPLRFLTSLAMKKGKNRYPRGAQ